LLPPSFLAGGALLVQGNNEKSFITMAQLPSSSPHHTRGQTKNYILIKNVAFKEK
jgi:hypothetical protein